LIGTTPTFARGTIEANLKLIKARATRDRLQKLLEDLGLDQTLLPEGIKTTLSFENSLFSYSIQRRLALARVILKDPLIILCEEPSQSGDEETEMLIQQNLRSLAESGKLVIYFTSSDSAAQISKRILDLDAITPTLAPRVSA
jgi:ATP-binding cassette subfamily C protein/ATP-binding cassette subfamily C protein LapB